MTAVPDLPGGLREHHSVQNGTDIHRRVVSVLDRDPLLRVEEVLHRRRHRGAHVAAELGDQPGRVPLGGLRRLDGERETALAYGPVEEPLRLFHYHQEGDLKGASRLSGDGHVAGVTAEGGDVVADPLQRRDQIEQAGVARAAVVGSADRVQVQESEGVQAVGNRDEDNIVPPRQNSPSCAGCPAWPSA